MDAGGVVELPVRRVCLGGITVSLRQGLFDATTISTERAHQPTWQAGDVELMRCYDKPEYGRALEFLIKSEGLGCDGESALLGPAVALYPLFLFLRATQRAVELWRSAVLASHWVVTSMEQALVCNALRLDSATIDLVGDHFEYCMLSHEVPADFLAMLRETFPA
jgi:hypothetical protein